MSTPEALPAAVGVLSPSLSLNAPLWGGVPLGVCLGPTVIHGSAEIWDSILYHSHLISLSLNRLLTPHFGAIKGTDGSRQRPQAGFWLRPLPDNLLLVIFQTQWWSNKVCVVNGGIDVVFRSLSGPLESQMKNKDLKMAKIQDVSNITQQLFIFSAVRGSLWSLTVSRWQLFGWTVLKCDSTWIELQSFASAAILIFHLSLHLSNIHTSTSHPITLSVSTQRCDFILPLPPLYYCLLLVVFFALLIFLVIQWMLQKEDLWQNVLFPLSK